MDFRILGPLEVCEEGRPLPLGGEKQRALLAVLLLEANQVVSTDRLIDALWGEDPPEQVTNALHVYVSQLRKLLERGDRADAPGAALVTRTPGYLLKLEPGQLDLHRFERLFADARQALAEGDLTRGSAKLRDALGLWRGPPLADLAYEPFAQTEIGRLEELRLAALEERIEADLAVGLHVDLVGELEALVARYPLRERLRGQLMLALYRSGRQAEALEAYQATRRALVEELGIEPSPALQRLEKAILLQEPSLETRQRPPREKTDDGRLEAPSPERPIASSRERRRSPALVAIGGIIAAVASVAAFLIARGDGELEAVGVVRPNTVVQIDPATNRVVEATAVGTAPTLVARGEGAIWVASFDDKTLSRIDPASGEEVARIAAGGTPTGLAVGGAVWVTHSFDGTLSQIDPGPGPDRIVATIPLGSGVKDVAVGEGSVWVANRLDGTVLRLDSVTGDVVEAIDVGGAPESIVVGEGTVWVASGDEVLRIDPTTNEIRDRIALRHEASRLAVGDGAVWIASNRGDSVVRVSIARGAAVRAIPVGNGPTGIAAGAGAVWVSNSLDGTVSRIDSATNEVVATVNVGHTPEGLAVENDAVWVAVQAP